MTFVVNSTADTADANIGDGTCATAAGVCTLRAAMAEANATPAADIIDITATGTIEISTPLPDIQESVTISGPGANLLTVRRPQSLLNSDTWRVPAGTGQFRIFHIPVTHAEIVIRRVSILGGSAVGRGYGGNIFSRSRITVSDCELILGGAGNPVFGPPADLDAPPRSGGAAIAIENADATLERLFIFNNMSRVRSTLEQFKDTFGAVLFLASGAGTPRTLEVTNVTFHENLNSGFSAGSTAGGLQIQVYAQGGAEVTTNLTNITLRADSQGPPLGSHLIGAGTKSTFRTRNSLYDGERAPSIFLSSTADGAAATDNQIISLGHNLVASEHSGTSFFNATGDIVTSSFNILLGMSVAGWPPDADIRLYYGGAIRGFIPLPGSAAIDAGSTVGVPATDARGVPRDGTYGAPDIGAFESRKFTMAIDDGDNQTVAPSSNFPRLLSVVVTPNHPDEAVNGGLIDFTWPASGASASITGGFPASSPTTRRIMILSGKATTGRATANSTAGSYVVLASAAGVTTPRNFNLSNITPFSVNSITLAGANPTTASTLSYTVTFNGSATGGGDL